MNGWGILLEILITDFRFGGFDFGFWLMNVKMSVSEVVCWDVVGILDLVFDLIARKR